MDYYNTNTSSSSITTTTQPKGWSIININTGLRVFNTRLESQHEAGNTSSQHEAGTSSQHEASTSSQHKDGM
jgi:hypothetical protein